MGDRRNKRGIVRIRQEFKVELPWHRYTASWQPNPDGPAETFYYEDGPGWNDVEGAIKWGRQRAPIVYVRLGEGWSDVYNAGERDDHRRYPTKRWAGAPRRRAANRHPDYAGVVYIGEEFPSYVPTSEFTAWWTDDDAELEHRDDFTDVEAAVDWDGSGHRSFWLPKFRTRGATSRPTRHGAQVTRIRRASLLNVCDRVRARRRCVGN